MCLVILSCPDLLLLPPRSRWLSLPDLHIHLIEHTFGSLHYIWSNMAPFWTAYVGNFADDSTGTHFLPYQLLSLRRERERISLVFHWKSIKIPAGEKCFGVFIPAPLPQDNNFQLYLVSGILTFSSDCNLTFEASPRTPLNIDDLYWRQSCLQQIPLPRSTSLLLPLDHYTAFYRWNNSNIIKSNCFQNRECMRCGRSHYTQRAETQG